MDARRLRPALVCALSLLTIAGLTIFGPQAYGEQKQEEQVAPGKSVDLYFPELSVDRTGAPARMRVRLPDRYSPEGTYPLIVWLGGGSGKPNLGPPMRLVDRKEWVVVSLPYPRGANDRYQSNMVGNFPRIWRYHRVMLVELLRRVPNISPNMRYVVGFSNGGHCIDGLLAHAGGEPASFYSGFVLVDGGGARGMHRYPLAAAGKRIFVLWGGRSPMRRYSPNVVRAAQAAAMDVTYQQMEGVGHAFPKEYKQQVAEWINRRQTETETDPKYLGPPTPAEFAVGTKIMNRPPQTVPDVVLMQEVLRRTDNSVRTGSGLRPHNTGVQQ